MFTIPVIFSDFEKDINKNLFNHNFLKLYHRKLCDELIQLFQEKNNVTNDFSGSLSSVVVTGTVANTGE